LGPAIEVGAQHDIGLYAVHMPPQSPRQGRPARFRAIGAAQTMCVDRWTAWHAAIIAARTPQGRTVR
jgi:hypothetical protein